MDSKVEYARDSACLTSCGSFSSFIFGDETIRFRTSPKLICYKRVQKWEDGYIEVIADYGKGEEEDYIDMRPILDNLYYDTDEFLKHIKSVEVHYV